MDWVELLFQLIVAHAVLDFMLQPNVMASGKSRHSALHEQPDFPPWYYWLASHGLAHGGAVFLITGNVAVAVAEVLLHTVIDYVKCEKRTTLAQDQALHIACKVAYCFFLL